MRRKKAIQVRSSNKSSVSEKKILLFIGRPLSIANAFGRPEKKHRPMETATKFPEQQVAFPDMYRWKGIYFGKHKLLPGAFLQDPQDGGLYQVEGVYELNGSNKAVLGIGYFKWEKDTSDRLDEVFRLPLYKKDGKLHWLSLSELTSMVRELRVHT